MPRRTNNELPLDIYVPFVETLFRDTVTLVIGVAAQGLLALVVYWKTQNPVYLSIALSIIAIGCLRLRSIAKYKSLPTPQGRGEARRRENVYIFWGTLHAFMLGLFCFVSIFSSGDSFAEIASLSVTLGSVTSIAGRNYGSPRLVMFQIVGATGPITLALLMRGDPYHVFLGLLSAPFFFAIKKFADIVREVLFSAVSEEKKANRLAQRFNRALNTMSHGLVMLGPEGRVIVANAEAAKLMAVSSADKLLGRSIKSLMLRGVAGGVLSLKDSRYAEAQLVRALREGRDRKILIGLANGRHYEFSAREARDEIGVVTFEDVTSRVEAEEKIRYMARFDSLTGLPNRAHFHEMVAEYMMLGDPGRCCALAVVDLDDFKNINDTLGHPVGDGLIYAVAQRLAQFAGEDIKVSRFGGDEFMIYVDRVEDEAHLEKLLAIIFAGLQGEVDVAGHSLRIQASAGAVIACVAGNDVDGMFVKADLALYKAKEFGKNGWQIFESTMDAEFRSRQILKADLRSAVEADGLRVVYQPIVAMETMRIASCEALCRWDHPELGPISPTVFIPLAEEMGIISDISAFMLRAACAECVRWPKQIRVSINLSARDFRNRDIVQTVREALAASGLAPSRLEIEVTETALLDDKSSTRQFLEELKLIGVRIALDDFGTGYSSLSYLHTLPLDRVKIDRSFLIDVARNARSLELLKGIVNLSRPLGLSVTVEGVETFDQLKILAHNVKPDLVQGFLFGSALTASGIQTMSSTVWPFAKDLKPVRRAAAAS
jgi:diguanylate cyclase (GGDEF)-like protein